MKNCARPRAWKSSARHFRTILSVFHMLKKPMSSTSHLKTPLAKSSLILMLTMLVVIIGALIGSGLAFKGFMGGGRSWIGMLQAFLLCFGIGALIYVPAAAIFAMARHVRGNGPVRKIGLLTAILALPYWSYGIAALGLKSPFWMWAALATAIGLYLSFWALIVIRHGK